MSIRPLALAAVLLLAPPASAGETWVQSPVNGHWYTITEFALDWQTARGYAQSFGGDLVTIRSLAENQWIMSQFAPQTDTYIGYSDIAVEGTWVWSSGDPSTYTNWAIGEPNDAGAGEDFATIRTNGTWNDIDGVALRPAIMEVVNGTPGPGADIPILGPWTQSPVNGLYYAASFVGMTWPVAQAIAQANGGHLATVRDAQENNWLSTTFVTGTVDLWLGLNDVATEGTWVWDSGVALGYQNWAPGEPNNAGNEDFGSMKPGGQWNDLPITTPLAAIIERAAPPDVSYHGQGCAGSGGFVPRLLYSGGTTSGSVVTLELEDGLGGSQMFLMLSGSTGSTPISGQCLLNLGAPLFPAILGPITLGGTGPGQGAVSLFATLPTIPFNVSIGMQAFVLDPGVVPGFSTTSALVALLKP